MHYGKRLFLLRVVLSKKIIIQNVGSCFIMCIIISCYATNFVTKVLAMMMINTKSENTTISNTRTTTTTTTTLLHPFVNWLSQVTDVTSKQTRATNNLLMQYATTESYSTSDEYPPNNRMTVLAREIVNSDDEYDNICTSMSEFLVQNEFEPNMNSCQCIVPDEFPDINTTRSFFIDCSDDDTYEQCLVSNEVYCMKSRWYLFIDNNMDDPGSTPSLAGMTGCIHYTSGNEEDDVCITTSTTGIETSCQIQIGYEFCDQCELVRCNKGDTNTIITNYTKIFDNTNNVGLSFTCPTSSQQQGTSNIYMNQCGYAPYTNVASPICNPSNPMRFLCHPYNQFTFNPDVSSSSSILSNFLLILTAFTTIFVLK